MAKIGKVNALAMFSLDPDATPGDRSTTGLIWKSQNLHTGATTKPGDKVYFGERWQRGSIPYASVRRILKEHALQVTKSLEKPSSRIAAEEIAKMRSISAVDEKQRAIEKIKRQFVTDGEEIIWRDNFRNAVGGTVMKSPVVMIRGRPFKRDLLISVLCGDDFDLPDRMSIEEYRELRSGLMKQARNEKRTQNKKMEYLEYRGAQMRGEIDATPATVHEETEAYLFDALRDIAILKGQMDKLMKIIPQ